MINAPHLLQASELASMLMHNQEKKELRYQGEPEKEIDVVGAIKGDRPQMLERITSSVSWIG